MTFKRRPVADLPPQDRLPTKPGNQSLGAWFLGPKAENEALLLDLVTSAVKSHSQDRRRLFPADPPWLTEQIRQTQTFRNGLRLLRSETNNLLARLDGSVPFYSYRYQAHMAWDVTLPAMMGYISALLYNQNNIAAEGAPVTTQLEIEVGRDLCRMIGFPNPDADGSDRDRLPPWGHITSCGTVANMEAMWSARNLVYFPLAVRRAADDPKNPELAPARDLPVTYRGQARPLASLTDWEATNLSVREVLDIPWRLEQQLPRSAVLKIEQYGLQQLGVQAIPGDCRPAVFASGSMHYSWPKAAALIGIGRGAVRALPVDLEARLDVRRLETELHRILKEKTSTVVMVVAIAGSTMEGAVDSVSDILRLREELRGDGLDFIVHVDGAWGGYFTSVIREPDRMEFTGGPREDGQLFSETHKPILALNDHVQEQMRLLGECDSVTVDPHKSGYCPFPAGALCYRDRRTRSLVTFTAPIVHRVQDDPVVGIYGIEGSKPGAAAAAVYLSHRVLRPDRTGYGRLLGRCTFNAARMYAGLLTMATEDDPFRVVLIQRTPQERAGRPAEADVEIARQLIVGRTNLEILEDQSAMSFLASLGSDTLILTYAVNFKHRDGTINTDLGRCNRLNAVLYERLSVRGQAGTTPNDVPFIVTGGEIGDREYGEGLIDSFVQRLGLTATRAEGHDRKVDVLVSTVMDPWFTDTEDGNMIPRLITSLRQVINQEVERLQSEVSS